MHSMRKVRGVDVPSLIYGTAWKEARTEALVQQALASGFRGFDTANQRKHYYEEGVGKAIREALDAGVVRRDEVFLQTKFTFRDGQDHRLPYDPASPIAEQVVQSFESSRQHLTVEALDSLILHGPSRRHGLGDADHEAWRAMEALAREGHTRLIGVSNVTADQLEALVTMARVPPAFVQNRCFAQLGWDADVREVCERHDIVYQAFSLLTANREVLASPDVGAIAASHQRTVPQVIFRFALQVGMLPLTGTGDPGHMREDLQVFDFELSDTEVRVVAEAGRRRA